MHKTKANEPLRSPSITPHTTSSKQNISKKKPPAHTKPKPQEVKTAKPHSRCKKNRTNSQTPKTVKNSIYERVFHNSNLSDTDISSKIIEVSRPTSKISRSLLNRLELTQKVKEVKKPSPFIDQIIKKSLNKAKKLKQSQEKENRKVEIKKEIKKHEMNYQNQQIRMENSLKYKKRKKSIKKAEHTKVRSESSSKVMNYASLFIDPAAKNKRSVSIGEYYSGRDRRSDTAILDYIHDKDLRRREEENFELLHQKAAEISRAERLHNLELFTKNQRIRSPNVRKSSKSLSENEEYEEKHEEIVQRNISFIEDNSDIESISQDEDDEVEGHDENYEKPTISDYEIGANGRNGNLGVYSETDSQDELQALAATLIQREFRKYLIRKYLNRNKNLHIHYTNPQSYKPIKKTLKLDPQKQKISIKGEKIRKKLFTSTLQHPTFHILSKKPSKPKLSLSKHHLHISPNPKPRKLSIFSHHLQIQPPQPPHLSISKQYNFTIFPDKSCKSDSGQLHDQVKEQIAWNSAQSFIIEQLRCEEISTLSSYIKDETIKARLLEKVNSKYSGLLTVLKQAAEFSQNDFLENLSVDEYSKFEKNKQSKQELLHKVLIENEDNLPRSGFALNLDLIQPSDQCAQPSSDLSSDEGEIRIGISHSRSLSQLHGDLPQGKYVSTAQNKDPLSGKFPIFFEIDDSIEVQSINLLTDGLPSSPNSHSSLSSHNSHNLPSLPNLSNLSNLSSHSSHNLPNLPTLPNLNSLPMLHLDIMNRDQDYSEPRILTSTDSILEYIKSVISTLNFSNILQALRLPLERNLQEELFKVQEKVVGTPSETKIFDFPSLFNLDEVLDAGSSSSELETTLRQISKADKIHKKMLLQVLNVQLQQFRPNGVYGKPLVWSSKTAGIPRPWAEGEVIDKVLRDIEVFSLFQIGRIFNEDMMTSNGGLDEGIIQSLRDDRLDRLISFETVEDEMDWVDYEFEEAQVKFDIADMILEHLADEVEFLL